MTDRPDIATEQQLFDLLRKKQPLGIDLAASQTEQPLSDIQVQAATETLGFQPPKLMIRLYREFGNGGFGMGYGMMGLGGGYYDDMGNTCDQSYAAQKLGAPDDPTWDWPEKLLPFCDYGCAIYACLDCNRADARVVIWDPNTWQPGISPKEGMYDSGKSFLEWMYSWASGVNLWDELYNADPPMTHYYPPKQ